MILGYIPAAVVCIPIVVATIRQSLYYRGCMDGFEFFLGALAGYAIGGILNIIFLILVGVMRDALLSFNEQWKMNVARGGVVVAIVTLIVQIGITGYFMILKTSG